MIKLNGKEIKYDKFSGGEVYFKIESPEDIESEIVYQPGVPNTITANITNSDEVFVLMNLKNMLDNVIARSQSLIDSRVILYMPYLPYARHDRPMHNFDSHALKVFCNLINSLNFTSVIIHDCHSDVGIGLLNNCANVSQDILLSHLTDNILNINDIDYIIAPDNGAVKKASKIAEKFKLPLITCLKERDLATGHIIKYRILDPIEKPGKALIVDDKYKSILETKLLAKVKREEILNKDVSELHILSKLHNLNYNEVISELYENINSEVEIDDFNSLNVTWIIISFFFEICDIGIKE